MRLVSSPLALEKTAKMHISQTVKVVPNKDNSLLLVGWSHNGLYRIKLAEKIIGAFRDLILFVHYFKHQCCNEKCTEILQNK